MAPMFGVRQHPSNGWRIARERIGDDHARLGAALAVKHPMQEALGSHLLSSLLDQDVQYDAMLINGSPQPVAFAADLQRHLVQMPLVAGAYSSSTQPCSEGGAASGPPTSARTPNPTAQIASSPTRVNGMPIAAPATGGASGQRWPAPTPAARAMGCSRAPTPE